MVWEQKDFTCIVTGTELIITNLTNQTIFLNDDFYFEIEYDSLNF